MSGDHGVDPHDDYDPEVGFHPSCVGDVGRPEFDAQWFRRTAEGVTLVTQPMIDKYLASK